MYVADELGFALKLAAFLFRGGGAAVFARTISSSAASCAGVTTCWRSPRLLGIFVLVSANNLLTVYLGVELLALSVYALVAFDRDSG